MGGWTRVKEICGMIPAWKSSVFDIPLKSDSVLFSASYMSFVYQAHEG